jgi:hypothetical protein
MLIKGMPRKEDRHILGMLWKSGRMLPEFLGFHNKPRWFLNQTKMVPMQRNPLGIWRGGWY